MTSIRRNWLPCSIVSSSRVSTSQASRSTPPQPHCSSTYQASIHESLTPLLNTASSRDHSIRVKNCTKSPDWAPQHSSRQQASSKSPTALSLSTTPSFTQKVIPLPEPYWTCSPPTLKAKQANLPS